LTFAATCLRIQCPATNFAAPVCICIATPREYATDAGATDDTDDAADDDDDDDDDEDNDDDDDVMMIMRMVMMMMIMMMTMMVMMMMMLCVCVWACYMIDDRATCS